MQIHTHTSVDALVVSQFLITKSCVIAKSGMLLIIFKKSTAQRGTPLGKPENKEYLSAGYLGAVLGLGVNIHSVTLKCLAL